MLPSLTPEQIIEKTVREEWGRILASLVGGLKDFQLAEDCLQDAVVSAMGHWAKNGLPRSPAGWLITVARRNALDKLRRDQNFATKQAEIAYLLDLENRTLDETLIDNIPDKRLEMIFTCCHPHLEKKDQVALTLRTLGGLSTEEIAGAFLDTPDAMQKRITRAKKKISQGSIPYEIPVQSELMDRVTSVLSVIYLVFNEGYSATKGDSLHRNDLTQEAIRLARILASLLPEHAETAGLLALMLLHDSRRQARTNKEGNLIPLEAQNRKRWNQDKIVEGVAILEGVLPRNELGPYQLQAAISGTHAQSVSWEQTDWDEISTLYELLYVHHPSPVVRINQAVAASYAHSPEVALDMLKELRASPKVKDYQPYHAALGDVLARVGDFHQASTCYQRAAELSDNAKEKAFLNNKSTQAHLASDG
ncbi:RNA polymerase sigma factor [Sulfitobacter sp. F26204]|uniref:RNA polymerase sigma factor n=1 Tax=Sulfitobacter sp. F26204 TaxID=2996014 RepID=UPI00225E5A6F|nr:RNA polymerase sigma factor [Sulfitobacter sp. F26204]MCX7561575.1 RNA polymerase sigma factor [Sulfitobacter sp. F26204]